ncbi:MAG: DUF456 domain-containing protein [Flavobacteriales bacterium]|nr:DUF456 domain-containing protein [Flavobacteriales bacterium]
MEITIALIIIAGLVLNGMGIIGCILPVLPGPLLSWVSLLLFFFLPDHEVGLWTLGITFTLMLAVSAIDLIIPILGAKRFGASREGIIGGALGIIIGVFFFPPVGIILGPLVGTVVGDMIAGGTFAAAFNSGLGSLIGFLVGTSIKLAYSIAIVILFTVKAGSIIAQMMTEWFG